MKYVLAVVAVSYALRCLSLAVLDGVSVAQRLRIEVDKLEHEAQQPGLDIVRRIVEGVWFVLYLLITYRLVTR